MSSDSPERNAETMAADNAPRRGSWLRRYLAIPTLLGLAVIIYIVFFGEKSVTQRVAYQHVIDSLQECLRVQQDSLAYYRDLNRRLTADPELMEQVVRERYNMKRANEDVFIIKARPK